MLWWEVSTDLVFLTGDYKELTFHSINIACVKTKEWLFLVRMKVHLAKYSSPVVTGS